MRKSSKKKLWGHLDLPTHKKKTITKLALPTVNFKPAFSAATS